jgi:hypothetical protein
MNNLNGFGAICRNIDTARDKPFAIIDEWRCADR